MIVKGSIFNRNQGLGQQAGYILNTHQFAIFIITRVDPTNQHRLQTSQCHRAIIRIPQTSNLPFLEAKRDAFRSLSAFWKIKPTGIYIGTIGTDARRARTVYLITNAVAKRLQFKLQRGRVKALTRVEF